MDPELHSHHPLYAFLQPRSESRHEDQIPNSQVYKESSTKGNGDGTKHLLSLLTTVRAHSTQLDQLVNHLNSLVTRVESVESIFAEGHEQVQQMVTKFQSDATTMALQTGDRVNSTLEPALNSFNHSISSINQQLLAVRTASEPHTNTHSNLELSLCRIEKDVHHLSRQIDQLDARQSVEKSENLTRFENLEKEFKTLNSALEPNVVLVPLLQAFLQSQLRSSRSLQEQSSSLHEKTDVTICGEIEMSDRRKSNLTRVHSSRVNTRPSSTGATRGPQISPTGVLKTASHANANDAVEGFPGRDQSKDSDTTKIRFEAERPTRINQQCQSGNATQKITVEHEPTVTQESVVDSSGYRENSQQPEEPLKEASQMQLASLNYQKRRSNGQRNLESSSSRLDDPNDNRSRKRSRSLKSPEFSSNFIQRKVSFKSIQASTIVSTKNDPIQSQFIKETEKHSVHYKKPVKKNRRPLLMEETIDTNI